MALDKKRKTLLINLLASIGIILCGIFLGSVARDLLRLSEQDGDNAVSEVITPDGRKLVALAYQPEKTEDRQQAVEALKAHQIESLWHAGKIMVNPQDTALAMDCLSALGMVPGTEHFTPSDVQADPKTEPRRYQFQQQLAVQNTLAKMLPVMSPAVTNAKVQYLPVGKGGGGVRVTLQIKPGTTLTNQEKAEMRHNIQALGSGVQADTILFFDEEGNPLP